jgi:alpha-L-fucosidase
MSSTRTLEAIKARQRPEWYDNAKLGIFIHWGVFSVPAWAPFGEDYQKMIKRKGYKYQLAHNPYAEWYPNTMRIKGSPSHKHHVETYGENFSYYDFIPEFAEESANMNAESWADLFEKAGARYSVMVTKHHDGYTLWPTEHKNPKRDGMHSERDFVGEVTAAVRAKGLKMGLYYSGGLDWTFKTTPISDPYTFLTNGPQQPEYVDYANNHMRELIARYKPSILWNDIRYPEDADLVELFSDYYEAVPEGVINDRWSQKTIRENPILGAIINLAAWFHAKLASNQVDATGIHYDYVTPEYVVYDRIRKRKWEACRGLGTSFGYNRNEPDDNLLTAEKLIRSFVDIVSKNGNLLINVGPMADGTIPEAQRERLIELGNWLSVNGDAIYDTRPWITANGRTTDGKDVRFTQKGDALFAVVVDTLQSGEISLESLEPASDTKVYLLGHDKPLDWRKDEGHITISLPDQLPDSPAHAFKMTPAPRKAQD